MSDSSSIPNSFVSIVILNYNGIEYIEKCLESVYTTIGCKFEVILIDNASTDGSQLLCKKKFPEIRLFQNDVNLAMAARNIGIDNAIGKYIVFLDSDATVHPNWLQNLIKSYLSHGEAEDPSFVVSEEEQAAIIAGGMAEALKSLDERARDIVQSRWLQGEKTSLKDLAEKYGVSIERIRQVEAKAFKTMQPFLQAA